MSLSTPNLKFLLDENVDIGLYKFFRKKRIDVVLVPKGISDEQVALISKKEKRVLVTNDEDFTEYSKDAIFAVIWLCIPQGDLKVLLFSFEKLLKGGESFSNKLVILKSNTWDILELGNWE